jgi:hypothetical protein
MTYTIVTNELLYACIPDGDDVEAALAQAEREGGVTIARDGLTIRAGLTLTNDPAEGDTIAWQGNALGWLTDSEGNAYNYAVRAGVAQA